MSGRARPKAVVLTGDVIGSTRNPAADPRQLLETLREAAEAVKLALPQARLSSIDIFRGDSWQMLVEEPQEALRAALLFRSRLRGGEAHGSRSWDTRIGIGIGSVEWIDEQKISQSQGEAFVASGSALDSLGKSRRRMAIHSAAEVNAVTNATVVSLLDAIVERWTAKQAWAAHGALRERTQAEIGQEFVPPVHQRTVADHLQKASWDAVESALHWWREVVQ